MGVTVLDACGRAHESAAMMGGAASLSRYPPLSGTCLGVISAPARARNYWIKRSGQRLLLRVVDAEPRR